MDAVRETCEFDSSLFPAMCVACKSILAGPGESDDSEPMTEACFSEVNRAETLLSEMRYCDVSPRLPNCDAETFPYPISPEPYMITHVPTRMEDITPLGNTKAGGYYKTPMVSG